MRIWQRSRVLIASLAAGCAALLLASRLHGIPAEPLRHPLPATWPSVFLWTWNRDEDLRFLPAGVGLAAVQRSIEFEGHAIRVRADHGVLAVPAATFMLPVVHVDAFARWQPALDAAQEDMLVRTIVDVAAHAEVGAVQVDFEALPTQRAFYRRVLARVRSARPQTVVSITALASWCTGDRWVDQLPVDDVVAMAFRLGRDAPATRRAIDDLAHWPDGVCSSTGIATDEPTIHLPAHRSLFLFSPQPWKPATLQSALAAHPT